MKWEGEIKGNVPEYSTDNVKRGFFFVLVGYGSYADNPECRPAICKCSCCSFYYWYSYSSRPKANSKHGWVTELANMTKIHPCGTSCGTLGPSHSQLPRILWSICASCFWLTVCLEWSSGSMTPTSQQPLGLSVASVRTNTLVENKTEIRDVSDKLIEWKLCLLVSQVMHVRFIFQELVGRDHVILFSIRMIHL